MWKKWRIKHKTVKINIKPRCKKYNVVQSVQIFKFIRIATEVPNLTEKTQKIGKAIFISKYIPQQC